MTSVESIQKAVFDTNSNLTTGNESIKEVNFKIFIIIIKT